MLWVCGFAFSQDGNRVALLHKRRGPEFNLGKWNGIGGKIEEGEQYADAMIREFKEEAGLFWLSWTRFCILYVRNWGAVHFYKTFMPNSTIELLRGQEDEPIEVFDLTKLPQSTVPNLRWLIPLALDKDNVEAIVQDLSK